MTKTKPTLYQAEFKESAVKLAIESKRPIAQTAKELGVTKTTLYNWVDKYSKPKEVMWLYFSGQLVQININRKDVENDKNQTNSVSS